MNPTQNRSASVRWALAFILAAITFYGYSVHEREKSIIEGRASTWTRLLTALGETNTGVLEIRSGETRISWASPEAMTIFGYESMKGLDITDLMPNAMIPKDHNKKVLATMEKARAGVAERRVTAITCTGKKQTGEEIPLIIRIFLGDKSVIALINRAEETRYIPLVPLEVLEPQKK